MQKEGIQTNLLVRVKCMHCSYSADKGEKLWFCDNNFKSYFIKLHSIRLSVHWRREHSCCLGEGSEISGLTRWEAHVPKKNPVFF